MDLTKANEARLAKAMQKLYRFDSGIMSLGDFLAKYPPIRKSSVIRHHETKRRDLEYKPLSKPKTEYTLWTDAGGYDVPKIVFDLYDIPATETKAY